MSCVTCECEPDEFQCDDGNCINSTKKCDGIYDCNSGIDEYNCCKC